MTARNYDVILTVDDASAFVATNAVYGLNTLTEGIIANVNYEDNTVKVKISNLLNEFATGESLISNAMIQTTLGNTEVVPYVPTFFDTQIETANSDISVITPSAYIAEKNAFQQQPIVRLYTLFYPGEWYPPNNNGNPTNEGAGYSWPVGFPFRFAEIRGDLISDIQYNVTFGGISYVPYPINSSGIQLDSSGKVNEITISVSNFDNLITQLVENPFIAGNNNANAVTATVNGELVTGIDPRTVPGNSLFDQSVVDSRGSINLAFSIESTEVVEGHWTELKLDSRDLLGGVVEIKSTFASFLDTWPEYSTVTDKFSNAIEMVASFPYREGDVVTSNSNTSVTSNLISIQGNFLFLDNEAFAANLQVGEKVFIVNSEADEDNFVLDNFKIDALKGLDENLAIFGLTSWLQFFKFELPKRRYLKNVCPFIYKGERCQYADSGTGPILNDEQGLTANGFFNINNATISDISNDVCAKDLTACELRNNQRHFGGFPSTGRTVPK